MPQPAAEALTTDEIATTWSRECGDPSRDSPEEANLRVCRQHDEPLMSIEIKPFSQERPLNVHELLVDGGGAARLVPQMQRA